MNEKIKETEGGNGHEDIFDRMRAGISFSAEDADFYKVGEIVARTLDLSVDLNNCRNIDDSRKVLSKIVGYEIDSATRIFVPFHTNFGKFIHLGKNVFINHACSFLDMGGITLEDDVLIGPRVNLITENHPIDPANRQSLIVKPIIVKRNAWIGAGSTILPGVTIGENAIVAAGAVVSKDVAPNTIVGGIPAKVLKTIDN